MIKKKCERQAKEKEEKCKKANELAALKRKTEITKTFAHRSRIPLANNYSVNILFPIQLALVSDKVRVFLTLEPKIHLIDIIDFLPVGNLFSKSLSVLLFFS